MHWLTSDTHYYHKNIIKYCNRPFSSVEEMNETMIENHNKVVKPTDTVFHLGDFGFARPDILCNILRRLNGKKILIVGNHDKQMWDREVKAYFDEMTHYKEISIRNKQKVVLCHYPFASWNGSFHGSFHLHGHTHTRYKGPGRILDVGVDGHNFTPWSYDEIEQHMNSIVINQDTQEY